MGQTLDRRIWLKQAALFIGSTAIGSKLIANEYDFQSPPDLIRINANENPYGPSPMARKAMSDAINLSNRYPWNITTQLREKIAQKYGLTKENILVGAGSSEILGLVADLAGSKKGNAITADPTFGIWFSRAQRSGLELIKVPLTADKKHDLPRMKEKINNDTRLVYICNPNNPTGTVLPSGELRSFIDSISKNTWVLLDEAYTEYSDEPSLTSMIADHPNLIIAKTFSKIHGLAGARIGYGIAQPQVIKEMNDLQPWSNAGGSAVSVSGAIASLDDQSFLQMSKTKNNEVKQMMYAAFKEAGINYIPSHTNFVYYTVKDIKGDIGTMFSSNNIAGGRITEEAGRWSRISVGTMDEMKTFLSVIKQNLK